MLQLYKLKMLCEMMIQLLSVDVQLLQGHPENFKPHMQTILMIPLQRFWPKTTQ